MHNSSRSFSLNANEILERAATSHITADELDILVTKTRELSVIRERELKHLQHLLLELEAHLEPEIHSRSLAQ